MAGGGARGGATIGESDEWSWKAAQERRGRAQAGAHAVVGELVHPSADPADCVARGKELADELASDDGADWALLVLADGACTHAVPGAGWVDGRAAGFDESVAVALRRADPGALAAIDAGLAAAVGANGRAAWQVLAGVAIGSGSGWSGELLYSGAPYGVGYHVALWEPLWEPQREPREPR